MFYSIYVQWQGETAVSLQQRHFHPRPRIPIHWRTSAAVQTLSHRNPDLPTYHNNQLKIRLTTQVLCSLKATATHIYWQELLTDKKYTIRQWPAGHNGFLLCCCTVQLVNLSATVAALLCHQLCYDWDPEFDEQNIQMHLESYGLFHNSAQNTLELI